MSEVRAGADDVVRHIERSLLCDTLGEDGGLGDIKFKSRILLEDVVELRQDPKSNTHFGLDVTVIRISKRPGLRVLCKNTSQ